MDIYIKLDMLYTYLKSLESVAIAFSGGVDSTFLLKAAKSVLGDKAVAVTVKSCLIPKREENDAEQFCKNENINHYIVEKNVFEIEGFAENPINRCYICKNALFSAVIKTAEENGIKNIAEGSNIDDSKDYRPGMKAISELNIKSPLKQAGFNKTEIRQLSKELKLKTWDKPSFACLASRFVYGESITKEKLKLIENAEQFLFELDFKQFRVRIHNNIARIEIIKKEFLKMIEHSSEISKYFKEIGFDYITMDLEGYREGSMNETLNFNERK